MNVFESHGLQIKYKREGTSGPPFLLLHGFGGGPQDWQSISENLSRNHRLIIPNLKTFFSHESPLTFTEQVQFLNSFVSWLLEKKQTDKIKIMGQSYGATLSLALRLVNPLPISSHFVLNPMPFQPLEWIRNDHLKVFVNLGHMPGAVQRFFRSPSGRKCLIELAQVFRIGALGHHEISHINSRKLNLVEKAIDRFLWINRNENWANWENVMQTLPAPHVHRFIYSSHDSLFSAEDYKKFAFKIKASQIIECQHEGHLLVQDQGKNLLPHLSE